LEAKAVSVFVLRGSDILIQHGRTWQIPHAGVLGEYLSDPSEWDEDAADLRAARLRKSWGITGLSLGASRSRSNTAPMLAMV